MTWSRTAQTLDDVCPFCKIRKLHVNKFGQIGSYCGEEECYLPYKREYRNRYVARQKAKGLTLTMCLDKKLRWLTKEQIAEVKAKRPKKRYPSRTINVGNCIVPGCAEKAHAKRMCTTHYIRKHKGDPNWNRLKTFRQKRGTRGKDEIGGIRPPQHVTDALKRAAAELGISKYRMVLNIMSLWERQYAAGGYINPMSPGNIIDPQAFYGTNRHMRT